MSYHLPPLNGLRAFEAAARHLSFKHAASELHVTPGAVGQQVRALEEALGLELFRRLPRGLVLTEAGEAYLPALSAAFRQISNATREVAPTRTGRLLRLAVGPILAACPAVRSLGQHKGAKRLADLVEGVDLTPLIEGRADALLRPAGGHHPGFHAEPVTLRTADGRAAQADLVTLPGLAGCVEHRALVAVLRR